MVTMSVVVPVFNRVALLRETVESLRSQTLADAEFIIVDDRSAEETARYVEGLPSLDSRFRVFRKPEQLERGCQASRNLGFDAASGEMIVFLDSDDLLAANCLEIRLDYLRSNPGADVVVGRQAILSEPGGGVSWVNVERADISDLDRFLLLERPQDVPWVNGGVAFRASSLRNAGVRWRPEFHWDDVAFHFECLARGLTAGWMPRAADPDSYYRRHDGERYGSVLFSAEGIRSTAAMLVWMAQVLRETGVLTEPRRHALVTDFFHACLLRAVDSPHHALAETLLRNAAAAGLLHRREELAFRAYIAGRSAVRRSRRLTYYWNRVSEASLLADHFPERASTFGATPAATRGPDYQRISA